MPDFGSCPLPQEPALRESAVLPIGWAVLDVQRVQWQSFADEVVNHDSFSPLVVTLAHSIVSGSIRWNAALLRNILSPDHTQRDERLAALVTLQKIAYLPPSATITDLRFSGEQLQGFMRPILPPDDGLLRPTWVNGQQSLGSTPITHIATELQKLGCPLDLGVLVARRRQLLAALSHHQIQTGPINQPLSMPWLREYSRLRHEVVAELGKPVHNVFMETIIDVVVLSRCKRFTPFLNDWSLSLEAENLISKVHAALDREPPHSNKMLAHNEILLLLVAAFEIQRLFFGPGVKTDQGPYLPSCLSREGPGLYKNAALSYAQYSHREPTLSVFSPSLSSKPEDSQEIELWRGYWNQRFPSHWSPYAAPEVTFRPGTATRKPSMVETKSHFSDDDRYIAERPSVLEFITGCFRK